MSYLHDFSEGQTPTLFSAIVDLGLLQNLELCLDAGDVASVSGPAPTKWLDTSGNGYDFFLGTDATAEATDPTFNGMPGVRRKEEYFSVDGGDYFVYDSANEAWMDNLHKDNAVFSFAVWAYLPTGMTNRAICGTMGSVNPGISFDINGPFQARIRITDAVGAGVLDQNAATVCNTDSWNFIAVSLDETVGASGVLWNTNGTATTDTSTFSSPSADAAGTTMALMSNGAGNWKALSGTRMAMFSAWSRALSAEELSRIYQATRGRFGV